MKKYHTSKSGLFNRRVLLVFTLCLTGAALAMLSIAATPPSSNQVGQSNVVASNNAEPPANVVARQVLNKLQGANKAQLSAHVSRQTGNYNFVSGGLLVADKTSENPQKRAFAFLATHGALVGINDAERAALSVGGKPVTGSDLRILRTQTDSVGVTHVRLDQYYQGLRVFGAQLVVHMNNKGITCVNGDYVPQISFTTTPALTQAVAEQNAVGIVGKVAGNTSEMRVDKTELAIYPLGLFEGTQVQSRLAYAIEVSGPATRSQVWIDANNGSVLNIISLRPDALFRIAYSPQYDPNNPNQFVLRKEGDPPLSPVPGQNTPIDNLYDFTGQTYNFYASTFGRDSYDALGKTMRTVLLVNEQCPNAYWNGSTTNYCPGFDEDDVVSHEWSHAYTEYTHGLVYAYQSGALNESYSDIFGETVDLLNGVDGSGGNDNINHAQYGDNGTGVIVKTGGGERFQIGEDFQGLNQPAAGILRDMYTPSAFGNPDKVTSPLYSCGADDGGGVHNNSGVPNHAYALSVDGGTFNGQTVVGIGLTKAAAIWFRAESVYQTPSTNFAAHEQAIATSCNDLINQNIYDPKTNTSARTISAEKITAATCGEVHKAMLAVEMSAAIPCNFPPLLDPATPPLCSGANTIFSENWESGSFGAWTLASVGEKNNAAGVIVANPDWPGTNWIVRGSLPDGHVGKAAFALDSTGGSCGAGGDISGHFAMISPPIVVPAGASDLKTTFDHFVQTENGADGGNLLVSVNGGAFAVVPQANYIFNAPNAQLLPAVNPGGSANTNPKAGEFAWTGSNQLNGSGSWGTTIVDLSTIAHPGDTIKLKFDFGQDGCGGSIGWFVDNIRVFNCPLLAAPVLSVGADYENPDTNGSFTLNWTRPAGASGPDVVQVSETSCAPLFFDNAESGLGNWTTTTTGTGALNWTTSMAKPQHTGTTFFAPGVNGITNADSYLTYNNPITIPATGQTFLTFSDWDDNEGDDNVYVEASENNGATWTQVYAHNRSELGTAAVSFATEPLFQRSVNLANYGGKTIRLRFHYSLGPEDRAGSAPLGWYVDDIAISNDSWIDVIGTPATSLLTSKESGSHCYRVRTTYNIGGQLIEGPFSNAVNITVVPGVPRVTSRKLHGTTGFFDINLPLIGPAGVECRNPGATNSHQVVFHFAQPATFTSTSVTHPGGTADIDSSSNSGTEITVNLKNVSNAQRLTVNLLGANAGAGQTNISVPMGVLLGDTTGNGSVNSGDVSQTKAQSGTTVSNSNFRTDANANGGINSSDISLVKSKSGTALP